MPEKPQISQELVVSPEKIRGRKGDFQVTILNTEKQTITYQLKASDPEGRCHYKLEKDTVTVSPGATANVTLSVNFKKAHLTGTPKECNFTIMATTGTGWSKIAAGRLESPPLLPLWALVFGGILVVAVIIVAIVLGSGDDQSDGLTTGTSSATTPATSVATTPPLTSNTTTHSVVNTTPAITTTATTAISSMTTPTTTVTSTATTTAAITTTTTTTTTTSVSTFNVDAKINYMALSPDGNKLYAVDSGLGGTTNEGRIFVINTSSGNTEGTPVNLGPGFPFQIRLSPDGNRAYVAITQTAGSTITAGPNRIVVLDTSTSSPSVIKTIVIAGTSTYGPVGLVLSPSGNNTYVTHRGLSRVDGYDNLTGSLISSVSNVGKSPYGLAVTPDGKKLCVSSFETVAVIDISNNSYAVLQIIPTGLTTNNSHTFITMAPDGSRVLVTDAGDSRIAVIQFDPASGLPIPGITYIQTTAKSSRQVAISPNGNRGLVADDTTDLMVVDLKNNTQIGQIPIGSATFGVVWTDPSGTVAYVSSGGGTITKVTALPL